MEVADWLGQEVIVDRWLGTGWIGVWAFWWDQGTDSHDGIDTTQRIPFVVSGCMCRSHQLKFHLTNAQAFNVLILLRICYCNTPATTRPQ